MSTGPRIGAQFANYRIEALLGRGGVGVVYLAQDLRLPRKVALKILAADLADGAAFREGFVRESKLAASIDHPHIVPVYEAGEADGQLFIAMRHVPGADLRGLLRSEGRLDPDRALTLLDQVAGALDAAHERGLCHRDVKPANILVSEPRPGTDHAYLADFGLTRDRGTRSRVTSEGHFVGTVDYASPEQIAGEPVDAATDIYALGCVLYHCLAGTPPYPRDNDLAKMHAHLSEPPPRLSELRPDLPDALDRVIATALARTPGDRHPSGAALMDAARRAVRGDATTAVRGLVIPRRWSGAPAAAPARRPSLMAAALIAVAVAVVALLAISRFHPGGGTDESAEPPLPTSGGAAAPGASRPAGLASALLTVDQLGAATVTPATTGLRISDITCGAPPTGAVDEQRVAFTGRGQRAGRAYYDAVARFSSVVAAIGYMSSVAAAVDRCPQRLGSPPPPPHLGDQSLRLQFPNKAGDQTFDNTYVRSGALVCVVLVSNSGTSPPPDDDTMTVVSLAVGQLASSGS